VLAALMTSAAGFQAYMAEFARVRYAPSLWLTDTLKMAVASDQLDLCAFLLDHTELEDAGRRDGLMSAVLYDALLLNRMGFVEFLWFQDFRISHLPSFYLSLSEQNSEGVKQLLTSHPRRAAEIVPHGYIINLLNAEAALRVIDLVNHCALENLTSPLFSLSRLLRRFVKSDTMKDADMARVIGRLCEIGAESSLELLDILTKRHSGYAQSEATLRLWQEIQNAVKEPEMD
jgi:hypothetical protein